MCCIKYSSSCSAPPSTLFSLLCPGATCYTSDPIFPQASETFNKQRDHSHTNLDVAADQGDDVVNCHLHHNVCLWYTHSITWLRHMVGQTGDQYCHSLKRTYNCSSLSTILSLHLWQLQQGFSKKCDSIPSCFTLNTTRQWENCVCVCVFYHLCTGSPPHPANTSWEGLFLYGAATAQSLHRRQQSPASFQL